MDLAGRERRGQRLRVHVGHHQHAPVGAVLDDGRHEAVRAEADGWRRLRARRHATAWGASRTGRPAAAMAALTSAMEWIRRWKIEAARTASAPPSRTARTKSSGPAAPPDAMTGTPTRRRDRPQQLGVEARSGPVAVDRGDQQLAGAELDRAFGPGDDVEPGRLAAALDDDLPRRVAWGRRRPPRHGAPDPPGRGARRDGQRVDRDDDRLAPEACRAAADERRIGDRGGVERDLVGAGPEHVAHLRDGPHAAADGQRDERAAGRALDDVEERGAALRGGRDVEEDELVGALGRVALGELGRIPLIDEVDEARALDDATVGDVETRDDPAAQHQAARTSSTKLASRRSPSAPLRSGWNWTPTRASRAIADTNGAPWSVVARTSSSASRPGSPAYEWTK